MMMVLLPESKKKKLRVVTSVLKAQQLDSTKFASKRNLLMQFAHTHPFVDMSILQNYMQYTPNFIFSRDVWAEYYLKFQYGTEVIFDTLDLRLKELRFESDFMVQNYRHFRSLKVSNFTMDYISELGRIRSLLPSGFLDPIEYTEVDTHPRYGTADPKRPRRRLKYKNSKHYSVWQEYLKARRQVFETFSAYDKRSLAEKKAYFYRLPNFNVEEFCPSTFQEAIYFFSLFGAPASTCRDRKKIDLFYRCLLSGFFFERDKVAGVGYLFYERRLTAFQYLEAYQHQHRFEKYLSSDRLEGEAFITFFLRRGGVSIYNFFSSQGRKVQARYVQLIEVIRLKLGRSINSSKALAGDTLDLLRLWVAELSPFFAHNERSFIWLLTSLKTEVWFLTIYVLVNEFNNESRAMEYTEMQPGEAAYFWVDQIVYYLIDLPYDFLEHVWFNLVLLVRPVIDLFLVLPFWVLLDRLYAFHVSFLIIRNNMWYRILTLNNSAKGVVRGRFWKVPLVVLKWLVKIILYVWSVVGFLLVFDYRTYVAPLLQPAFPFDIYTDEVFVTYVLLVFTVGLLIFGSFTIKEFVWLEIGLTDWISLWLANLHWMWLSDPHDSMIGSYLPKWGYPEGWEDFSMLETEHITVSRDEEAGRWMKEWDHGSNSPRWRIYTFKLANDVPAWGDDHPFIEKLKEHRR